MAFKNRSVTPELGVLRSLNARMNLLAEEKQHYLKLEKGYQGEVMFDQLTEKLQSNVLVLNDLCLEIKGNKFQIDTLIIAQETIFPFEVKNFESDFLYESDSFQTITKKEILNPLDQLKRSKILLNQLLRSLGFQCSIKGYVVFINPEFTLYQAPLNAPIIYPTQLNRFMKNFDQIPSKLNDRQYKIAEQLISMHHPFPPYANLPFYKYEEVKKGTLCSNCYSFMVPKGERKMVCEKCGSVEDADSTILRSVEEIKLLFPDKKITTSCVFDWCGVIESKKKIRRVLKENYRMLGSDKWAYFE
jgi:DNA-directed RNA polymerase subunit M/transcription elongation factor TFIIS